MMAKTATKIAAENMDAVEVYVGSVDGRGYAVKAEKMDDDDVVTRCGDITAEEDVEEGEGV